MNRVLPCLFLLSSLCVQAATTIFTNSGNAYSGTLTNCMTNGMMLSLDFDNITWTSATVGTNFDKSGYGNHAGAASGINRTNSAVPGVHGSATKGQFANNYWQCRSDASIDDLQLQGNGGMTISFWWNPIGSSATIMAKGASSGRWDLSHNGSVYPYGLSFTKNCATTSYVENFANILFSNRWYHIVITWDGGVVTNSTKLWADGWRILSTSVTTGVGTINSDAANNLTLLDTPGNTATSGAIDDLRLFNRILSESEIWLLYNSDRVSNGQIVAENPFNATNILSFEGVANGTVLDTTLMGTATKGAAMGSPSITGSASDWTVVAESNMTAFNPITVAGVTYTAQSNSLACRLTTGSSSSLNFALPANLGGTLSGCFAFKTDLRQIPASGVNFDIFNVGAPSQYGIAQINEGGSDFYIRAHSGSNAVTYTGKRSLRLVPYQWYDCGWLWETNAGKFHMWVWNPAYSPALEESHRLMLYSISPIAANSNATYLGPINNPHGTARAGLTNYYKFIAWIYSNQTNAAMVALNNIHFDDMERMLAFNDRKHFVRMIAMNNERRVWDKMRIPRYHLSQLDRDWRIEE